MVYMSNWNTTVFSVPLILIITILYFVFMVPSIPLDKEEVGEKDDELE